MKEYSTNSARGLKLFLKSGRVVQVYPADLKGYENGETPVGPDRAPHPIEHLSDNGRPLYRSGHTNLRMRSQTVCRRHSIT